MKKTFTVTYILFLLFLSGCGNTEMVKDAQKLAELKCKSEQSFNKILALNNEVQRITQEGMASGDINIQLQTVQKQQEVLKKLEPLQAESNQINTEVTTLQKEIENKYNTDKKKKAFAEELNKHLGKCK